MFTLLKKEIRNFFSSLTGYIVIVVFLITNSLFMWVFPGQMNILDNGVANLDTMFFLAPWIFLFLVPAVCMRLFSEEKKNGTIEFIFTKPLTDLQIVLAKYIAGVILVLLALLPTLIYLITIHVFADEKSTLDFGGIWGSYIGLFFLAAIYVSIGVFSSALTDNQIIAFIIGLLISFFFLIGFEFLSSVSFFGSMGYYLNNLGINEHYKSLSRGVIDTRDLMYFVGVIAIFILGTKTVLESRKW